MDVVQKCFSKVHHLHGKLLLAEEKIVILRFIVSHFQEKLSSCFIMIGFHRNKKKYENQKICKLNDNENMPSKVSKLRYNTDFHRNVPLKLRSITENLYLRQPK